MLKRIIRIRKRAFDDLNRGEVVRMLEADSALSPDGNESFSGCALDEFLYSTTVHRADLLSLRDYLLSGIYRAESPETAREVDTEFLRRVIEEVKRGQHLREVR